MPAANTSGQVYLSGLGKCVCVGGGRSTLNDLGQMQWSQRQIYALTGTFSKPVKRPGKSAEGSVKWSVTQY